MDWIQVLADMENLNNYVDNMEIPGWSKGAIIERVEFETALVTRQAYLEIGEKEFERMKKINKLNKEK